MTVPDEGVPKKMALKRIEALKKSLYSIHMPTSLGEMNLDPTEKEVKLMIHKCSVAIDGVKDSAKVSRKEDMLVVCEVVR